MENLGLRLALEAQHRGWISPQQIEEIRSEIEFLPLDEAAVQLVARGLLSQAQVEECRNSLSLPLTVSEASVQTESSLAANQLAGHKDTETTDFTVPDSSRMVVSTQDSGFELSDEIEEVSIPKWFSDAGYQSADLFAEGGLSKIWVVKDPNVNRTVALKQIRRELANHPTAKSRFRREAEVTGQLEHPNIVPVYQVSTRDHENLFYTMRLVQGKSLRQAIDEFHESQLQNRARRLELLKLLQAFIDVCQAIGYAHSRGVIHRDIKPENIVLGSFGEVVVLDWGLAKTTSPASDSDELDDSNNANPVGSRLPEVQVEAEDESVSAHDIESNLDLPQSTSTAMPSTYETILEVDMQGQDQEFKTVAGAVLGTPAYMAPEQANTDYGDVNHLSDVYGLGATLYRILTGKAPRRVLDLKKDIPRLAETPVPPAAKVNSSTPRPLNAICAKAMHPEQAKRYASALELATDVQRYLADEPVSAWREPLWITGRRWLNRHRTALVTATALLFAISLASLIANVLLDRARKETQVERRNAELLASEMTYNRGLLLCQQGEIGSGLLWFTRCLENLPDDSEDLERVLRMSIASWKKRLSPMERILETYPNAVSIRQSKIQPWILIASSKGWFEVVDTNNGRLIGERVNTGKPLVEADFAQGPGSIYTVGEDSSITIWDGATRKPLGPFVAGSPVDVVVANRLCDRVFAGCENGKGFLWSISTGELVSDEIEHDTQILSADFSRNGRILCVGDASNKGRVYDPKSGKQLGEDLEHAGWVMQTKLSSNGEFLATATNNNRVYVWELQKPGRSQQPLPGPAARNGRRNNNRHDLPKISVPKESTHIIEHQGDIRFVKFNGSGTVLMTGASDNKVRLLRTRNGREVCPPLVHVGVPLDASFYDRGTFVVTGSSDNVIRFWDARTGKPSGTKIRLGSGLSSLSMNPSGDQLVTFEQDGRITTWQVNKGDRVRVLRHDETVYDAEFHPDGRRLVTATSGQSDTIRVWDLQDAPPTSQSIPNGGFTFDITFNRTGKMLLSGGTQSWLRFWDLDSKTEKRSGLSGSSPITSVAISNDNRFAARIGWDEVLQVTDLKANRTVDVSIPTARQLAMDHASKFVATAGSDGLIQVWSLPPLLEPEITIFADDQVRKIVFSPDDQLIASAGRDRAVRIWSMFSGQEVGAPMTHRGAVNAVAFSPNGLFLATACDDGTCRVWDIAERKEVTAPLRHDGAVLSVAFSADGRQIATSSHDKTTRIWRLPSTSIGEPRFLNMQIQRVTGSRLDEFGNIDSLNEELWNSLVPNATSR